MPPDFYWVYQGAKCMSFTGEQGQNVWKFPSISRVVYIHFVITYLNRIEFGLNHSNCPKTLWAFVVKPPESLSM